MSIKWFLLISMLPLSLSGRFFTVVLDPGIQSDSACSAEALKCVETVRQVLEDSFAQARIALARTGPEAGDPVQIASYSNRIHADLHITFNFSTEKNGPKTLRIFTCSQTQPIALPKKKSSTLALVPLNKVHEGEKKQSCTCAKLFFEATKNLDTVLVANPASLPLRALEPLVAPAFLIECGITKPKEWRIYFPHLCEGLKEVIAYALAHHTQESL